MTVNLLTDNQASVETDTTGIFAQSNTAISRDTGESQHGTASLKSVTDGVAAQEGCGLLSAVTNASEIHTASVYVKGSGTVFLILNERDGADASIGDEISGVITLTGSFVRHEVSKSFGATGVRARIRVQTDVTQGITFHTDCLQIEQAASAGEWRLPSQGSASPSVSISLSPSVSLSLSPSASQSPSSSESSSPSLSFSLSSSLSPSPSWPGLSGTMEVT